MNRARNAVRAGSGSRERGRAAPIDVHAPFCPLRGKKRELERSRQCESRQGPAASLPRLARVSQLGGEGAAGPPEGFLRAVWDRGTAPRDVQAQTWKQTAAPECNPR